MAVTLGFMFRIDSFPPAVAQQPQHQPVPTNGNNQIIEAEKVQESSAVRRLESMPRNMAGRFEAQGAASSTQQLHTYNQRGNFRPAAEVGQLLNVYA